MNRYTAFVVTDDELFALDSFAQSDGITIKEVISRLILDEVQRRLDDLKRIAPPVPAISCDDELEKELQAIRDDIDRSQN